MGQRRLAWLRFGAAFSDAIALASAWVAVVWLRSFVDLSTFEPFRLKIHLSIVIVVVPIWLAVLFARGAYSSQRAKDPTRIASEMMSSVPVALLVTLATLFVLRLAFVSRTVVVGFALVSLPALVLSHWLHLWFLHRLRAADIDLHRVLLAGAEGEAAPFREAVASHPEWGLLIVGRCDVDEVPAQLEAVAVDEVYLTGAGVGFEALKAVAWHCERYAVRLSMDANFLTVPDKQAELVDFDGWSVLTFSSQQRGAELVAKRIVDVTGALMGLMVLAPIMAAIAVAIRLVDGGPAVFSQERSGRYGQPFTMYKFRSMVVGAEGVLQALRPLNEADGPAFKLENDPRLTRLGTFLRQSSLDELPQLWNVLVGEMSLVGPRPPIPEEVEEYERWQLRRLSMKPGLTCIWQVSGRSNLAWQQWMLLDLEYIDNWSLALDFRLMLRTIPAVISGEGAR